MYSVDFSNKAHPQDVSDWWFLSKSANGINGPIGIGLIVPIAAITSSSRQSKLLRSTHGLGSCSRTWI